MTNRMILPIAEYDESEQFVRWKFHPRVRLKRWWLQPSLHFETDNYAVGVQWFEDEENEGVCVRVMAGPLVGRVVVLDVADSWMVAFEADKILRRFHWKRFARWPKV